MTSRPDLPGDAEDEGRLVRFEDFRDGWRHGRFHVVVNPELAPRFVAQRTFTLQVTIALVGCGIALALAGYAVVGLVLVAAGIVLRRSVRRQAPQILLHLVSRHAGTYYDAAEHGVMEVQRRG